LHHSREFLRAILVEADRDPPIYYLDAHWQDDLPLLGEFDLIPTRGCSAAIMIDDFAVPSDPEYCFDDYGPGKALRLELLAKAAPRGASLFFPTLPACQETGARRGCAVIGIGDAAAALAMLPELQQQDWPTSGSSADAVDPTPVRAPDMAPLSRLVTAHAVAAERHAQRQHAEAAEAERDAAPRTG
jgi:hypothetical protein